MTTGTFDALFDSFDHTAFRLEALPAYAVGGSEGERLHAFREGLPRPERSVRTSPWLARIAMTTATAGKSWSRVRVVDTPLTDYQRYQMESLRESQAAGEEILVVTRTQVGDVGPDFWLFDADTPGAHAVQLNYGPGGEFGGFQQVPTDRLAEIHERRDRALAAAVPLNVFLAEGRSRG